MEIKTEEEKRKIIKDKRRKWNIITNIILIILFLIIFVYMILNVEELKLLNGDVCKLCMEKTKAICFSPS